MSLLSGLLVLTSAFELCFAVCHQYTSKCTIYMYLWQIIFRTALLQVPKSVIATFGETATFNCSGRGSIMTWLIDGTDVILMSPEMINLRGIEVATMKSYYLYHAGYVYYTYQSSISMTANCINNLTTVQCRVSTCWLRVQNAVVSLQVEGTVITLLVLASIVILLDDAIFQPPNITAIGQNSVLIHLDASNASYNVTVVDMSNGSIVMNETVSGNSNAYKLELVNPDPCHLYNVSMELNYYEKCTSGIATYSLATFEASEFEQFVFIINSYMNLYISQSHLRSTKRQ